MDSKQLTGWKTKTSGILSIIYGVAGIFLKLHDIDAGVQFIVQGIGILGIGHKIEKAATNG